MAFMKNINDPRGILTLLVLAIPTIAANIDCNGKPFHCLNSTHFMICVDVGSGVSSTLDDFVIPCPPTTVCKGTNRFECEFFAVPTTTSAPLVVMPETTSVGEITTPVYDVTTSIPFEEYYNTLSTTTLSENDILTEQTYVTESIVQPTTNTARDIDVFMNGSELKPNMSDIIQGIDVVKNNFTTLTLLPNNISGDASNGIPHAAENFGGISSDPEPKSNLSKGIPTATNIAQKSSTNISLLNTTSNSVTESILLGITETAPSVSTFTETIQSGDVVEIDTNTESMIVKVTETIPSEITSSVDVVRHNLTIPETYVFINTSVDALDFISSATENSIVIMTISQNNFTSSETPRATDIVKNDFTSIDVLSSTALPTNADTTPEPHTQPVTGATENLDVINSVALSNNAVSTTDNVTESIFFKVTKPLVNVLTLTKTVSSGNDDHIDANTDPLFAKVTEMIPSESSGSTSSVDIVQNVLQTQIHLSSNISDSGSDILNAKESASNTVTESESNITFSKTTRAKTIKQNEFTPLNDFVTSTQPAYAESFPETTENLNVIISGYDTESTLLPKDVAASDSTSLKSFGSTLSPNNITETITELSTPNDLILGETTQGLDFATHKPTNINVSSTPISDAAENNNVLGILQNVSLNETIPNTKYNNLSSLSTLGSNFMYDNITNTISNPLLIEVTKTTPSTLILSGNIPNVEAVSNDYKIPTTSSLYDITANATENLKEMNKTVIKIDQRAIAQNYLGILPSSSLTDAVTDTITESIFIDVTRETPSVSIDSVKNYISRNTSFDKIKDDVTELTVTDMVEKVNAIISESNLTLSLSTLNTSSNLSLPSNMIEIPTVTNLTENKNLGSTESNNTTLAKSIPAKILQYDKATSLISTSNASQNNEDAFVITENPIILHTENHSNQTFRESFSGESVSNTPLYIESIDALQSETEPTVTSNDMLVSSLANKYNKSNKTNNNNMSNGINHTEESIESTTESYADFSVFTTATALQSETEPTVTSYHMLVSSLAKDYIKSNNNDVNNGISQTEEPIETTTESHTDFSVFTTVAALQSETEPSVTSDNTLVSTLANDYNKSNKTNNNDMSNGINHTEEPIERTTESYANFSVFTTATALQSETEPTVTSNHMLVSSLAIDNIALKSNGSLPAVNESSSDVPLTLVPTMEIPKEPTYFTEAKLIPTTASTYDIIAKPISNSENLPITTGKLLVTTANTNEVINTEPTTLGTTSTVTKISIAVFSETANNVPASEVSITESAASHAILISPIVPVTKKYTNPSRGDDSYKTTKTAFNNEATPLSTENSSVLYPTKEGIATEVRDKSYDKLALNAEDKSEVLNSTQLLPSLLVDYNQSEIMSTSVTKQDITTSTLSVGDPDFNKNIQNTVQQENLKTSALDPFISSNKSDGITPKFIEMEENVETSKSHNGSSGNTLVTDILAAADNVTVVTESNYSVNRATDTLTSTIGLNDFIDNVSVTVSIEAIRGHSPLINLLLEQIPHRIPASSTEKLSLKPTSIQLGTNDVIGDSNKINTESDAFIDLPLQESYTESIVSNTAATFETTFPSKENLAYGAVHASQETGNSTLVKNKPDTHQDIGTIEVEGLALSIQYPVDTSESSSLHNTITESIPINNNIQSNTGNDKNDATITVQNTMLLKPATDAATNTQNADTIAVETQASQGLSSDADVTNMPAVTLNQDSVTLKLERGFSNTPTIESTTESWRIVYTKPYIQTTRSKIATQPMVNLPTKAPNAETVTGNNTAQISNRLNANPVLLSPVTQFVVPQYITRLSNLDERLDIEVTSTPVAESFSHVPQTNENNFPTTTKPILDKNAPNLGPVIDINVSNKNDMDLTSFRTEFISTTKDLLIQTEQLEQVITQNPLHLNLDKGIAIVNTVQIDIPVLEEGNVVTGTHSDISVLTKPPKKSIVEQSETTEGSESVEKTFEKEKLETPKSNKDIHITTPAVITLIANPKEPISGTGILTVQYVNENIDRTNTTITVGSESSVTNNKVTLESPIEMTTKKVPDSNQEKQSIINIELISAAIESSTESLAQAKNADISSVEEKSVTNGSIVSITSTHVINNVRSNIENSTTGYSPTTKPSFANIHNASLPTFKSATKPRSYVCKKNSRGRFSDSKDCRKFYICIGKPEPIEGFCPNNTVFSELRKQCTKNLSHCVRNNQFQCIWEGRFSDYLNDNIYYVCVKNNVGTFIRFKLQCQSGYHLNKTSVRCALNTESNQSTSQQSTSDISKYSSDQSASSVNSEKLEESSDKFVCKKEGKFPDANNCRKYYVCTKIRKSEYKKKNKKCDSDEIFHKDKKKCVDADSYECN